MAPWQARGRRISAHARHTAALLLSALALLIIFILVFASQNLLDGQNLTNYEARGALRWPNLTIYHAGHALEAPNPGNRRAGDAPEAPNPGNPRASDASERSRPAPAERFIPFRGAGRGLGTCSQG